MTAEKYAEHITFIEEHFPGKVQLLLQSNTIIKDKDWLQWYIDLGITKFCVGTYEQGKILKEINSDFDIVGSITMKVQPEDLENHPEYKDVFSGFVLFWNYHRDFDLIKTLPKDYHYILLVNCCCNQKCDGSHHWHMPMLEFNLTAPKAYCPNSKYVGNDLPVPWDESSVIRPQDLPLFYPYIHTFKIQGREYPTGNIISDLLIYLADTNGTWYCYDNKMLPDINLYRKKK